MTDPNEALAITRVEFAGKRRELPSDEVRALRLETHQLRMQINALALSRLSAQARADHLERMLAAEGDRLERNDFLEHQNKILREQAGALRRELADVTAERDRLRVVRCPDGKTHRWDGDGQCKECRNYATDLIDAALQEGKGDE